VAPPTKFVLRARAISKLVSEAKALEDNRRLTASAFMACALKNAATTRKRIDELRAAVDARRDYLPNLVAFIEAAAKELGRTSRYVRPPDKVNKVLACWSSASGESEMRELGATVLECVALAVLIAIERFPDWGGAVDDIEAHDARIAALHLDIAQGHRRLREMYTPQDVTITAPDPILSPDLAKNGWSQISFAAFPGISPSMPNWPALVVEAASKHAEPEPEAEPATAEAEAKDELAFVPDIRRITPAQASRLGKALGKKIAAAGAA